MSIEHPSPSFETLGSAAERHSRRGFTLLEILLAVTIMGIVMTVTFMTFTAATTAWQKGTTLVDSLHHGDYVIQQLVMGLRSAYYPETGGDSKYGFVHEDDGDEASAEDTISWVKLGGAMIGRNSTFSETPHRVEFFLADDEEGERAAAVKAWRLQGQLEDFDPEDVDPVFLSKRVVGFNCRMAWELDEDGEIDWLDEWEETNKIPTVVEISLYVTPPVKGDDPVEMKRVVGLRVGALAWQQ
ncbi:MAG: prepilin-type N-terminal cleavage/methylation domain-containing protein [Verrucomicrobia bacterium]|nr:prepilin-type N-terminal cleavage/methylation domain-containing protein [Verrucomicrobiota bacterium]